MPGRVRRFAESVVWYGTLSCNATHDRAIHGSHYPTRGEASKSGFARNAGLIPFQVPWPRLLFQFFQFSFLFGEFVASRNRRVEELLLLSAAHIRRSEIEDEKTLLFSSRALAESGI